MPCCDVLRPLLLARVGALSHQGETTMAETVKKQIKVLVIGTEHPIQRHQDTSAERKEVRKEFEKLLRQIIKEQKIDLIAEEAGDNTEVWKRLKRDDELAGKYAEAFGGGRTVDAPVPTIAKKITSEQHDKLRHVDVRAPNAEELSIEERDAPMVAKIMEVLGDADNVLVIVGEKHRAGVVQRLKVEGMSVESMSFSE